MKLLKKLAVFTLTLYVFTQIIPYQSILNVEDSSARFITITEKSIEETDDEPTNHVVINDVNKSTSRFLRSNINFQLVCDNDFVQPDIDDNDLMALIEKIGPVEIGLYTYDEKPEEVKDVEVLDVLKITEESLKSEDELVLNYDPNEVGQFLTVYPIFNDEPYLNYPLDEFDFICDVQDTYGGTFSFSRHYSSTGDELTLAIRNGQPNTCGDLHKTRNGVTSVSDNWVCTDSDGDADMGPWTAPGVDETTTNTYVSWPGGGQTNSDYHIWDVNEPEIDIDSTNFGTDGFSGTADDGNWGTGFDFSPGGWSNSYATFYDQTDNKYWSFISGEYTNPIQTLQTAQHSGCSGSGCDSFDWSVDKTPIESAHQCDHVYVWKYYTSDYFYSVNEDYTFTYDCPDEPPVAIIETDPDPATGVTPLDVDFDGSNSYDPDGTIVSFEWDYSYNGSTFNTEGTGVTATHRYTNNGSTNRTFTAALKVTDNDGYTDIDTVSVTVEPTPVNNPPTCTLSATPGSGQAPLGVRFTVVANDPDPGDTVTFLRMDFDDGAVQMNPTFPLLHTYSTGGTYYPELRIRDNNFNIATCDTTVVVSHNQPPVASFVADPMQGSAPLTVDFDASASYDPDGTIVRYTWGFGDISPLGSGVTTSHTYNNPGTYTVRLVIQDDDGATDSTTRRIIVTEEANAPIACFTATPTNGSAPLEVTFDASCSSDPDNDITAYDWTFGDGGTASGVNVTHTFDNFTNGDRDFIVVLTVTDSTSLQDTEQETITVTPAMPGCELTISPETGQAPQSADLSATYTHPYGHPVTPTTLDFGDGSAVVNNPTLPTTHIYYDVDTFTAVLTVRDPQMNTGTCSASIVVENSRPLAEFTADPTSGNAPLDVSFDASASWDPNDTIVSYEWDFDDGTTGSGVTTNHTFTSEGEYTVVLTVTDTFGATDTFAQNIEVIENRPPECALSVNPHSGPAELDVTFNALWSDPEGDTVTPQLLEFGDGSPDAIDPSFPYDYTYTLVGTFRATLTVEDDHGNQATCDTAILVSEPDNIPPEALFDYTPDGGVADLLVSFDAGASNDPDGTITSYDWDFGDGSNGTGVTTTHTYTNAGVYSIILTVTDDDGATDTATGLVKVSANRSPIAIIDAVPTVGTAPLDVSFDGTASFDPEGDPLVSYDWDFGDTNTDSGATVSHTYVNPGVYTARLTVVDSYGLSGTADVTIDVNENRPPIIDADVLTVTNVRNNVPGGTVQLQGSAFDPDGDTMDYSWGQIAGSNTVTLIDDNTLTPSFDGTAGEWYAFIFRVDDNNGHVVTDIVVINMEQANSIPYVDADITTVNNVRVDVTPGTVQLAGVAVDPDGDAMDYSWTLLEGTSTPVLSDNTVLNPTFTGVTGEYYVWELTADDNNGGIASDTMTVIMRGANQPPVADAGDDQSFVPAGTVTLDGSGSFDPDGDPITYDWQQVDGSDVVTLDDNTLESPTFSGVNGNWYEFELTVTDSGGLTDTDSVLITMIGGNRAPIADAGPDQVNVAPGIVLLDGTGSYDPDGDPIFYYWQQIGGTGSAMLSDPFVAEPFFTGQLGETYEFELTVADIYGATDTDTVEITMNSVDALVITTDSSTNLYAGEKISFRAYLQYADGTHDNVTSQVLWTSTDTTVGTIVSYNTYTSGQFTALDNGGNTDVFAEFSGLTSNVIPVSVSTAELTGVIILPIMENSVPTNVEPLDLPVELEHSFHAFAQYDDGATRDVTTTATWASSNTSNVNVRNNVFFQGVIETRTANTSADITADLFGVTSAPFTVTVNDALPTALDLTYTTPRSDNNITIGQEMPITATATFDNGQVIDITDSALWTSTGGILVQNNRYFEGYATAQSAGFAIITAEYDGISSSETVFVNDVALTDLTIAIDTGLDTNPAGASVPVGVPRIYSATGVYNDGEVVDVTEFATWSSDNIAVANVYNYRYQEGYAETFSPGTAVVTAEFMGLGSNSMNLDVNNATLTNLSVSAPPTVAVGNTVQASAAGTFSDANSYDVTRSVVWSSNDPTITVVSNDKKEEGITYGVGVGSTNIQADMQGLNGNDTMSVTMFKTVRDISIGNVYQR